MLFKKGDIIEYINVNSKMVYILCTENQTYNKIVGVVIKDETGDAIHEIGTYKDWYAPVFELSSLSLESVFDELISNLSKLENKLK